MEQKQKIIEVFAFPKTEESDTFNAAFKLYAQLPNADQFLVRKLNQLGYSRSRLESLMYDLKKKSGVTDVEIALRKQEGAVQESKESFLEELNAQEETSQADAEEVEENPEDLLVIRNAYEANEKEFGLKLRDEFPFLNDENCPAVFAQVVFRKIGAYNRMKEAHAKLSQFEQGQLELTPEEQTELASVVEKNHAENRALYAELDHYATTGEILGKHDLFKELVFAKEVEEMTADEMLKYKNASKTFFSRKRKELENTTDEAKIAVINDAIQERELKVKLIDKRLARA